MPLWQVEEPDGSPADPGPGNGKLFGVAVMGRGVIEVDGLYGARRPVATTHAERPLSVRSGDLRPDARQWARRAVYGHR